MSKKVLDVVDLTLAGNDSENNDSDKVTGSRLTTSSQKRRSTLPGACTGLGAKVRTEDYGNEHNHTSVKPLPCLSEGQREERKSPPQDILEQHKLGGKSKKRKHKAHKTTTENREHRKQRLRERLRDRHSSIPGRLATQEPENLGQVNRTELPSQNSRQKTSPLLLELFEDEVEDSHHMAKTTELETDPEDSQQQHNTVVEPTNKDSKPTASGDILQTISTAATEEKTEESRRIATAETHNKDSPRHTITEGTNVEAPGITAAMESNLTLKVVFLGNVSVGKSTLLNTTLGNHYNPTSMKRSTSGIREFRLSRMLLSKKRKVVDCINTHAVGARGTADPGVVRDIRNQIHQDNEAQRGDDRLDDPMEFHIDIPRGFLGEQRDDVSLAFVDVPGLNETKKELYRNWVERNWSQFDSAVVVLDATQDCQTQDVVQLLDLVKACHKNIREIPLIFVVNKVDDTSNGNLCEMVSQIKADLKGSFENVSDIHSYEDLYYIGTVAPAEPKKAAFVPISAQYALLFEHAKRGRAYSCAAKRLEDFKKADVDFDLIEKFGNDEVGKNKWKRLTTRDEKYKRVLDELLADTTLLETRIEEANFKTFQEILKATVCGKQRQSHLLGSQLEYIVNGPVSCDQIHTRLRDIHKMAKILEIEDNVKKFFWTTYKACEQEGLQKVMDSVDTKPLATPAYLLHVFFKFVVESKLPGGKEEIEKIRQFFQELVRQQMDFVLKKFHSNWDAARDSRPPGCLMWETMTPDLWADIFDSMLLAVDGRHFMKTFGVQVIAISRALRTVSAYTSSHCKPSDIAIFHGMDCDGHWGHVIDSYCEFMELLKKI